jgi:hypothetical protein
MNPYPPEIHHDAVPEIRVFPQVFMRSPPAGITVMIEELIFYCLQQQQVVPVIVPPICFPARSSATSESLSSCAAFVTPVLRRCYLNVKFNRFGR